MSRTIRRNPNREANVWVVRSRNGWVVKTEGSARRLTSVVTQKEAVVIARRLARRSRREMIVQGRRGKIRIKNSYGRDLFPPRG